MERGIVGPVDTESLVPQNHLLQEVDGVIDFGNLYRIVEPLYSEDEGQPSADPMVLFKIGYDRQQFPVQKDAQYFPTIEYDVSTVSMRSKSI